MSQQWQRHVATPTLPIQQFFFVKAWELQGTMLQRTNYPTSQIKCPYQHHTLINIGNQHNTQQGNIKPPWILNCSCNTTQCKCLAKLRPDIVYINGATYEQTGPIWPTPDHTIQIIESIYTHEKFIDQDIQTKEDKHKSLIHAIRAQEWKIRPLITITWVRGAIHTRSSKLLELLQIPNH